MLQHWVTHIYSPFNATIRETATSRNERCQSKSKYQAAQQDLSTILRIHICSPCFFVSFCSCVATSAICARPVILSEKKCVRAFRKDAFRNKKNVENENNSGETKRIGPREGGREQREKQEGRKKSDENRDELRVSRGYVDASFIPDAIVRFSLVVLCHHSSRLTICPASGFTSLWIYRLSFFPWSCSRRLIAPPLADGERARARSPKSHR